MSNKPYWPITNGGAAKSLGDMTPQDAAHIYRMTELWLVSAHADQDILQVRAFIEIQTFNAAERLSEGTDMNEDGTDFA